MVLVPLASGALGSPDLGLNLSPVFKIHERKEVGELRDQEEEEEEEGGPLGAGGRGPWGVRRVGGGGGRAVAPASTKRLLCVAAAASVLPAERTMRKHVSPGPFRPGESSHWHRGPAPGRVQGWRRKLWVSPSPGWRVPRPWHSLGPSPAPSPGKALAPRGRQGLRHLWGQAPPHPLQSGPDCCGFISAPSKAHGAMCWVVSSLRCL